MLNHAVKMSLGFSLGVAMLAPPVFADTVTPCDSVACIKIQKDPWLATGLNVIPFGVGSYNQGDHCRDGYPQSFSGGCSFYFFT